METSELEKQVEQYIREKLRDEFNKASHAGKIIGRFEMILIVSGIIMTVGLIKVILGTWPM